MINIDIYKELGIVTVPNHFSTKNGFRPNEESSLSFKLKTIETIAGASKKVPHYTKKDYLNEAKKEGKLNFDLETEEKKYLEPIDPSILSVKGYIGTGKRIKSKAKAWENFRKNGIYGSSGKKFTYFSNDIEVALSHSPFENATLIELDIPTLSKYREIFYDPEALAIPSERGMTFVVMGGVPKEAITKIYHMSKI